MAIADRTFYGNPLFGMDYRQSTNPFIERTGQPGVAESPFLTATVNELNQVNLQNAYFNVQSASAAVASDNSFLGPMGTFQSHEGAQPSVPKVHNEFSLMVRNKHKRLKDDFERPLKKRRLAEPSQHYVTEVCPSVTNLYVTGDPSRKCWNAAPPQEAESSPILYQDTMSATDMHTVHNEEMEETVESICDATCERVQAIESRLAVDKDVETMNTAGYLPKLILSDILKEGLKNGFEECLTKKIVDSMNRPSMELVLWKPQPESLIDKLQTVSRKCKKDKEASKFVDTISDTPFLHKTENNSEDNSDNSNTDSGMDTIWCRDEEEMEL
ncbi:coiled-coil domain-containing protein 117 isoform 1-T2 [Discoglossus pictus]